MNYNLTEGLRAGDLADLVLPVISIDEYESKIEDDGLVVAFRVDDEEPGKDLTRFIEKSNINVLDAELSPGPDSKGYFYVFVEFIREEDFPSEILKMLGQVSNVAGIKKWRMKTYHEDKIVPVTEENIREYVRLKPVDNLRTDVEEQLIEELKSIRENQFILRKNTLRTETARFKVVAYGPVEEIYEAFNFNVKPVRLDESSLSKITQAGKVFGTDWNIDLIDGYLVCNHILSENVLILSLK